MLEIKIKSNKTNRKVHINDLPKIENIPNEFFNMLMKSLEIDIKKFINKSKNKQKKN